MCRDCWYYTKNRHKFISFVDKRLHYRKRFRKGTKTARYRISDFVIISPPSRFLRLFAPPIRFCTSPGARDTRRILSTVPPSGFVEAVRRRRDIDDFGVGFHFFNRDSSMIRAGAVFTIKSNSSILSPYGSAFAPFLRCPRATSSPILYVKP